MMERPCTWLELLGVARLIGVTHLVHRRKILLKALSGSRNIAFSDMIGLVEGFGFRLSRVSGSHHIFVHPEIVELVNLQEVNGKAKPYQVKQFLRLVEQYHLELEDK
jgi:predicted RNA binding protein YcfA (HicA-like mRNA interferase family)